MTRDKLLGAVVALLAITCGILYVGGKLIYREGPDPGFKSADSAGSAGVGMNVRANFATRRIACVDVPRPYSIDMETVIRGHYSDAAYRAAALRLLCNDQ